MEQNRSVVNAALYHPLVTATFHNTEHGTRNTEHGTRNTEHRTQNTEHGTRNTEHGTRNTEHGTRNTEQYNRHLFIVPRGLPGGYLGVARGLGGVNLTEPPRNPL